MIRRVVVYGSVKALRAGALGKPSVNSANYSRVRQTRNLCDLPMGRLKRELYRVEDRTH